MANKSDPARIVAETFAGMMIAGGTAAATAAGAPVALVGMSAAVLKGIFQYLFSKLQGKPDSKQIIDRIRDERTAHTVETIRDAYVRKGAESHFSHYIEEGAGHVLSDEMWRRTREFLARHLQGRA